MGLWGIAEIELHYFAAAVLRVGKDRILILAHLEIPTIMRFS